MAAAVDITIRAAQHFAASRLVKTELEEEASSRLGQIIARIEPMEELGIAKSPLAFFQRGLRIGAGDDKGDEHVLYKEVAGCQPCRVEGGVAGLAWDELMRKRRSGEIASTELAGLKHSMNGLDLRLRQRRLAAAIYGEKISDDAHELAWNELTAIVRFIDMVTKFARI